MRRTFTARVSTWLLLALTAGGAALTACSVDPGGGGGAGAATGGGATGGGATGGGTTGGGTPLRLERAEMISGEEVRLVFSEAMAAPAGVDPEAFRLSSAQAIHAGQKIYQACTISEGNGSDYYVNCYGTYYASCPVSASDCQDAIAPADVTLYREALPFARLAPGEAPNELVATLAWPVGSSERVAWGDPFCGDLHLHYAPGAAPVLDTAGDALAPIAPEWVAAGAELTTAGIFAGQPAPVDTQVLAVFCHGGNHCKDGIIDEDESDIDCGGYFCTPCGGGARCHSDHDCASGFCDAISQLCAAP